MNVYFDTLWTLQCVNLTIYVIFHVTVKFRAIATLGLLLRTCDSYVLTFRVHFHGWSMRALCFTSPSGCWEWRYQSHKSLHLLLWQHASVFPGTAPDTRLQTIDRPDTGSVFLILLGSWNRNLGLLLGKPVSTAEMWSCIRVGHEVMRSGALSSAQLRKACCCEEAVAGLVGNLIRSNRG